jgi:hypothetical protein
MNEQVWNKKYVKLFKKIKLEFFRISMKLEHEFFYIFKKSFCKNIRRFENFTLLTSFAVAHDGLDVVVGYAVPPTAA